MGRKGTTQPHRCPCSVQLYDRKSRCCYSSSQFSYTVHFKEPPASMLFNSKRNRNIPSYPSPCTEINKSARHLGKQLQQRTAVQSSDAITWHRRTAAAALSELGTLSTRGRPDSLHNPVTSPSHRGISPATNDGITSLYRGYTGQSLCKVIHLGTAIK